MDVSLTIKLFLDLAPQDKTFPNCFIYLFIYLFKTIFNEGSPSSIAEHWGPSHDIKIHQGKIYTNNYKTLFLPSPVKSEVSEFYKAAV